MPPYDWLQDQEEDDEEAKGEEGVREGEGGGVLQRGEAGEADAGEEVLLVPSKDGLPPVQDEGVQEGEEEDVQLPGLQQAVTWKDISPQNRWFMEILSTKSEEKLTFSSQFCEKLENSDAWVFVWSTFGCDILCFSIQRTHDRIGLEF